MFISHPLIFLDIPSFSLYFEQYHVITANQRGYVYDTETGLYYLNSRYYNPETGRFINADSVIDRSKILGANVFSYCFYGAVAVYGHIQNRTSDDCDKGIYFVAKDMVPHHKWNW